MSNSKSQQITTIIQKIGCISRRSIVACLVIGSFNMVADFSTPKAAFAYTCELLNGVGRWSNSNNTADPAFIDIKNASNGNLCADTGIMRVWVRQPNGDFYGRPLVQMDYKSALGKTWNVGRVYTGGYIDNIWIREVKENGERKMHVLIVHESLDSKPSAQSEHWFTYKERETSTIPQKRPVAFGRVPLNGQKPQSICAAAQSARARNSPAAPGLEAQCRAIRP